MEGGNRMHRSNRTALILLFASLAGLLAIFLFWRMRRQIEEEIILATEDGVISRFRIVGRSQRGVSRRAPSLGQPVLPTPPADDLEKIWGIGPKLAGLLRSAGIANFCQLADTGVERLSEILREAGYHLGDPEPWPRQARLAAEGRWDELAGLQDELRRRRRSRGTV
jgi:hypothetical protein